MIDYKTFKKGYLTEWVDRSQAARKAAEELANKEVKTSLRDKYTYEVQNPDLVFTLDGHKVEFKSENEVKSDGDSYFTYDEAMKCFGEPDLKDGWRLPTKEEYQALIDGYPYIFDKNSRQGIFGKHLYLPAMGYRDSGGCLRNSKSNGYYWSSTPDKSDSAWFLFFYSVETYTYVYYRYFGQSVRLVRDVK